MTCTNPIREMNAVVEFVKKTSGDPTPGSTISNALEITVDSSINLDQRQVNTQSDVASDSFSKKPPKVGILAGTASINGNLKSTAAGTDPAIGVALELCGAAKTDIARVELDAAPTNVRVGTNINDGSGNSGAVRGIVSNAGTGVYSLIVEMDDTDTFADGDSLVTTTGTLAVGTVDGAPTEVYIYKPNTESTTVGSVFLSVDGTRRALKDCASNITFSVENGNFSKFSLNVMGAFDSTNWADAAVPSATYQDIESPVFMDSAMLVEWNGGLNSFIPVNTGAEFNWGNVVVLRPNSVQSTGICGSYIASRADAGGSIRFQEPLEATFDYETFVNSSTEFELSYRIGDGTNGETVVVYQKCVATGATRSSSEGVNYIDLTFEAIGDDDDEQYLIFC